MATMTYRKLDANGDYTFGQGSANFFIDQPEAVGQAVMTALKLFQGEWFLDTTAGTPYNSQILGAGMVATYDAAIQDVILSTQGVKSILSYISSVNTATRSAEINCTIDTIYGVTTVGSTL